MASIQVLKTIAPYFQQVWDKKKTFEIRFNDRDFGLKDLYILREYEPANDSYSSREIIFETDYILLSDDFGGLANGYVCFGIKMQINTSIGFYDKVKSSNYAKNNEYTIRS